MGAFSRWDDWLVAEHEMIERAMEVLKTNLAKIANGSYDKVQTGRAIDFLLEFGVKIHNSKEENFLFPLMDKRGAPVNGGPISLMLNEHKKERTQLIKMQTTLNTLNRASEKETAQFVKEGLAYLTIRAEHIWKENDILYNLGRQVLTEADDTYLLEEFTETDLQHYGKQAASKFATMLKEVEDGSTKKKLIENLSKDQLHSIMETLPVEVTFVDVDDTVAYFNKLDKDKIFPRTRSVIGRKIHKCHPEKSIDAVLKIVEGFKNRTLDKAEFWIDFRDEKILIRYFPVYNDDDDDDDKYIGILEVTQGISWIQKLEGQKLLLD